MLISRTAQILFVLFTFATSHLFASDLAKEKRWAEQVIGDLFDGEPIMLNDGNNEFLSLWLPAEEPAISQNKTAVIVMHGIGIHPDWPTVVNPLRVSLAEKGWSTLSIQLPILDNEATPEDYNEIIDEAPARINSAIAYLQKDHYQKIFIVAHSMGTAMASHFLSTSKHPINAFVAVGMNIGNEDNIAKISIPMLDLYGTNDLEGVLASADSRKEAGAKTPAYTQVVVPGADHFFDGFETELIDATYTWLKAY